MKLRFKIDQASLFRRGINAGKSIVVIDVDPGQLPQEERDLVADHMHNGIDIMFQDDQVVAEDPTYESLILALRKLKETP